MGWRGELTRRAGVAAARTVRHAAGTPDRVARRTHIDPEWRRTEDGYAARLGPRETIDVARPVGHWRQVDPRRPADLRRMWWKLTGAGLWAGAVGAAWWLGSSRGRGPLAGMSELDRFGEAVGAALDGFDEG